MKIKIKYLLITLATFSLLVFIPKAFAAPSNNPIFATIQMVQQMISEAISPIQNLLDTHEGRIQNLENKVTELEERIEKLEPTPSSTQTPTPTPDLTPFEVQFSIVDDINFDKGTVQANKLIKFCTYGSSLRRLARITSTI